MRSRLPAYVETEDLVSAGTLGLVDAIRKFDVRRQVKLESYARHRIRGAILDSLRSLDPASRDVRNKVKKAEKVYRDLQLRLGVSPDAGEMARGLGMNLEKWYRTAQEIHLAGAGSNWFAVCGKGRPFCEETLAAENSKSQFHVCYEREQRDMVRRALECLSLRERRIFELYHHREMTMKEIGRQLNIDESRVSQLHSAGLRRLRSAVLDRLQPEAGNARAPLSMRSPAPMVLGSAPAFAA